MCACSPVITFVSFPPPQLEGLSARYREEKAKQSALEETYTARSEEVANLTNELARVSKKLEEVKVRA